MIPGFAAIVCAPDDIFLIVRFCPGMLSVKRKKVAPGVPPVVWIDICQCCPPSVVR